LDAERGKLSLKEAYKTALSRPWILLFREPIVLLLSIYLAIIYGTLYLCFFAYPVVYQQERGWSAGIGGLPFLGVAVGMLSAVVYSIPENGRYNKVANSKYNGKAPPEERLPMAMVGSIAIPVGLFWFAWSNSPSVMWFASVAAGAPFGFGMVCVFLSVFNYLIDSYTIYAASVLAANACLRSTFGAVFPLFTTYMYQNLGIHWASSVPAFLALACVPAPFLFYKYGEAIRMRCKYARKADEFMKQMQARESDDEEEDENETEQEERQRGTEEARETEAEPIQHEETLHAPESRSHRPSADHDRHGLHDMERQMSRQTTRSTRTAHSHTHPHLERYDSNPFDIDRVNSRDEDFE